MAASASQRKIDQVLAGARKELESELAVVRAEMARLGSEERELTAALANLSSDASASAGRGQAQAAKRSRRSRNGRRGGGRRGAMKPTAERVEELRALLAAGSKSRNELAAALKVSPARVQQLLGELGGSVSSQPDGRGKLWSLTGKDTSPVRAQAKRGRGQAERTRAAKPRAGKAFASK